MRNITRDNVTQAVIGSFDRATDERFKQIMRSLVTHLHAFAREVDLTHEEWQRGIDYLYGAGRISDDKRNEFILTSDLLGLSSLVDLLRNAQGETEGSVLGPFHASDSKPLPVGGDLIKGQPGEPVLVQGRVLDGTGSPVAGAEIDFWQTAANGLYWQQDEKQDRQNLRCRMAVDAQGSYAFTTVRPAPYTVPDDGPAGAMLGAMGRHPWRPAHFHFIVRAPGFRSVVTELFPNDDAYIGEDAVFGVRDSLTVPFGQCRDPALAARFKLPTPFQRVEFDFLMRRA